MSRVPRFERQDGPTLNFRGKGFLLVLIALGIASAIVLGDAAKKAFAPSPTNNAAPASNTLSPHEIHLNYKAMKDLPVHDSTNAN